MKKSLLLILLLCLTLSVAMTGCGGNEPPAPADNPEPSGEAMQPVEEDTSLSDIQEKGSLIIGCDDAFPPMGFRDDTNEVVGFDIDLASAVAEKLGVELVVKPIEWSNKEIELNNGNIDVIWNGYTITADRNQLVEYTKPYLNNAQSIVVKIDSDIATKEDLAGKAVGAQVESSGLAALNKDEISTAASEIKEYDTYQEALLDLTTTRLEAVVVDKILINYFMLQQPDTYKLLDESMGDEYYGIGCRKDGVALREAIDTALDELMEDESIAAISTEWFGENIVIRDVDKLGQEAIEAMETQV